MSPTSYQTAPPRVVVRQVYVDPRATAKASRATCVSVLREPFRSADRLKVMRKWITLAALALMLGACAPGYEGTPGPTTTAPPSGAEAAAADLARAKSQWASFGTADYTYQFTNDCDECGPPARIPKRVAVLAGQVLAIDKGDLLTVEDVFERIEQALTAGRTVEVSYDPETGLPGDVQIDMDMRPVDGGTHWILQGLTGLAPVGSIEDLLEARRLWDAQRLND